MKPDEKIHLFTGQAGHIETLIDEPADMKTWRGIALIAHPHPLFGGSNTNKVTHTLAKTFARLGFVALRPNFRGVGKSEGAHEHGEGETFDMLAVLQQAADIYGDLPIILSGFSFGAYVQTRVYKALVEADKAVQKIVLVGMAAGLINGTTRHYAPESLPKESVLIHGAEDTTVPLTNVLAWAEPLEIPVIVIPGADHFFHGKLHIIRDIVLRSMNFSVL